MNSSISAEYFICAQFVTVKNSPLLSKGIHMRLGWGGGGGGGWGEGRRKEEKRCGLGKGALCSRPFQFNIQAHRIRSPPCLKCMVGKRCSCNIYLHCDCYTIIMWLAQSALITKYIFQPVSTLVIAILVPFSIW